MYEKSLQKLATIFIPNMAQWDVSTFDLRRIMSEVAAQFEVKRRCGVVKKIKLLLEHKRNSSLAAQEKGNTLENLGMWVSEDPIFIKYLIKCNTAKEDICKKMERFGGKMSVYPSSHSLLVVPLANRKTSKQELLVWTETMSAALEITIGEYIHAEEEPTLVHLLHNDRDSLLGQFTSIRVLNQSTVIGHQQDVKELLVTCKELTFKRELIRRGWKIINRTSAFIVIECLKRDSGSRYPGLKVLLDEPLSVLLLEGPREEYFAAEERCNEILHNLLLADVQLTMNQDSFLKTVNLDKFNDEAFFSKGVLVGLVSNDGELKLLGVSTEEINWANTLLQCTIQECWVDIPDPARAVLFSEKPANVIDCLQKELNEKEKKTVDVLLFQDAMDPYRVAVVGRETEMLRAKALLERFFSVIQEEVVTLKTPGAWQYLYEEGRVWLKHAARAFSCVAELHLGQMFDPLDHESQDDLFRPPTSISFIEIHSVVVSSIAHVTTDVLVCPLAFNLDLKMNPFSRDIMAITREGIKLGTDCLQPKEIVEYSTIYWKGPTLYFVNFLPHRNLLGQAAKVYRANIRCCLDKCQASAVHSITFPIIGSGGFEFPLEEEIMWLLEEIMCFTQETDNIALRRVQLALPHGDGRAHSVLERGMSTIDGKLKPLLLGDIAETCRSLHVHVTGRPEDRERLRLEITRSVEEFTTKEVFSHHCLFSLTDSDLLKGLEGLRNHGILIRKGKEIHILGVNKFVTKASHVIKDLLHSSAMRRWEVEEMFRLVQWEYFDNGGYVSFDKRTNLTIERAFQKGESQLDLELEGRKVHLNLDQEEGKLEGGLGYILIRCVRGETDALKKHLKKESHASSHKNWQDQHIENPLISSLETPDIQKMLDLGKSVRVRITVIQNQNQVRLQGRKCDVMEAIIEIERLLRSILEKRCRDIQEANVSLQVQWMYRQEGSYHPFDGTNNCLLEKQYYQYVQSAGADVKVEVTINDERAKVDYPTMMAKLQMTKKYIRLKRIDVASGIDHPSDWVLMNGKHLMVMTMNPSSKQFRDVQENFNKTTTGLEIVKIERIQNSYLHKAYELRKKLFAQKNGVNKVNELTLFHGTAPQNCSAINHKGFNRGYTANAKLFGFGVYFAVCASYSCKYSIGHSVAGDHFMYQVKVIAGRYTQGEKHMKDPPARPGKNPNDLYDSVVDNVGNPSMYVVFHDDQAYPEYLITFKQV
ncbi:protein mono-ADP-ribosyltransferase PARP14-like [Pleurodeles waltl]